MTSRPEKSGQVTMTQGNSWAVAVTVAPSVSFGERRGGGKLSWFE
jgi:hypothetical protein